HWVERNGNHVLPAAVVHQQFQRRVRDQRPDYRQSRCERALHRTATHPGPVRIRDLSVSVDFTANFLDVLNLTNFQLPGQANQNLSSANFGQTTYAYQDLSNAQDPGARVIEFRLRLNF